MKILLATSEVPPVVSGMSTVARELMAGFERAGHKVELVAAVQMPRIAVAEMRLTALLPYWPRVARHLATADVVSLHGPVPTFSDLFLALARVSGRNGRRPPIAYTHHIDISFRRLRPACDLYNYLHRRLAGLADHVIVSTATLAAPFRQAGRVPVSVIPFGVHPEIIPPGVPKDEGFTVLFCGQLRPYKGVDVLLRAFTRLPAARLLIAGEGHEAPSYRRLARALGLTNVHFLGWKHGPELWELYARSHVIVLPSVEVESFGIVLLEGMAAACVPVASDLPGPRTVVADCGLIVPAADPEALAGALRRLQEDPSLRQRLADAARQRASQFTWERTTRDYLAVLEGLAVRS